MSSETPFKYINVTTPLSASEFEELLKQEVVVHISPFVENYGMTGTFVRLARSDQLKARVIWSTWTVGKQFDDTYTAEDEYSWDDLIESGLAPFNEDKVHNKFTLLGLVSFETEGTITTQYPIRHLMCYSGSVEFQIPPLEVFTTLDGILETESFAKHKQSIKKLIIGDVGRGSLSDTLGITDFPNLEEVWAPADCVWVRNCPKLKFASADVFVYGSNLCPNLEVVRSRDFEMGTVEMKPEDINVYFPNLKRVCISDEANDVNLLIEACFKSKFALTLEDYAVAVEYKKSRE